MLTIALSLLAALSLAAAALLAWAWRGQRREAAYWRVMARGAWVEGYRVRVIAAGLAERVKGQAELLAKRAEKVEAKEADPS